ncbi:unnamed protein product [Zymoseptoria tritici ST99CH_3D1]|uniref:Secreted protein n=1 Tax=Zymoseptoria tritici (strain ST99CH_3D7) TaxID=1276538 RepID=A0A1X7SA95_ZYMT9|nr:unnamed protein product [Zymoseptoria tritici ST99CH_3D7]SMR64654.1 unnamed protein product [Zymoseptoria tritici ST99CH_3D1]
MSVLTAIKLACSLLSLHRLELCPSTFHTNIPSLSLKSALSTDTTLASTVERECHVPIGNAVTISAAEPTNTATGFARRAA